MLLARHASLIHMPTPPPCTHTHPQSCLKVQPLQSCPNSRRCYATSLSSEVPLTIHPCACVIRFSNGLVSGEISSVNESATMHLQQPAKRKTTVYTRTQTLLHRHIQRPIIATDTIPVTWNGDAHVGGWNHNPTTCHITANHLKTGWLRLSYSATYMAWVPATMLKGMCCDALPPFPTAKTDSVLPSLGLYSLRRARPNIPHAPHMHAT
jgi:hypothetical protein